jgi:hypothetical protein
LAGVQTDQALRLIEIAQSRGMSLPRAKAEAAARGLQILKRQGAKLTVGGLRALTPTLRPAVRWVCEALYEVKGIDPAPYLGELDRLDALDRLEAVRRWRGGRQPTLCSERSPVDRAWIEANGY